MIRREEQKDRIHLLFLGMPRSGTSLLSSIMGAHSHVGMVNEDFGRSWIDIIGKPIVGNKLCVPRQLEWNRKRKLWVKVVNRFGLLRMWPKSRFNIKDYLKLPNLKIIVIHRNNEDVRNSIKYRGGLTWRSISGEIKKSQINDRDIEYTIKKGNKILERLKRKEEVLSVNFNRLIGNADPVINEICKFLNITYENEMIERGTRWNWMYPESKKGLDKSKL